jgi:hypothetical protein
MTITYEHQNPLTITLTPLNPPIQIPANGGSFNFNAAVVNQGSSQQPFSVWARIKYPDGSYTTPTLGPVIINPPLNVTVSRLRSQNVPSNYPAGEYLYLGYANPVFSYPAIDSASFTFTKSNTSDSGPLISEATCGGDLFPGEGSISSQPSAFNLWGANPNPFNPKTVLSFELRAGSRVSLEVYDNAGRMIVKLVDGWRDAGSHQATFDGSNLASGIYLYCLTAGLEHATGKMVLLK